MSKIQRCNRCAMDVEVREVEGNNSGDRVLAVLGAMSKLKGWSSIRVVQAGPMFSPPPKGYDLCPDCTEVLLLQFMEGGRVESITKPIDRTPLPHEPMLDCQLIWNVDTGRFLCRHDDPDMFDALAAEQGISEPQQVRDVMAVVKKMAQDVEIAGVAHAIPPQREASDQSPESETELGDE